MHERPWWAIPVLAVAYVVAAKIGFSFAVVHASATAVWPPTGLAIAAILLWGFEVWPAIAIGAFVANALTAGSALTWAGIATGNTLEALVGAWLVNRFAGGSRAFDRATTILRFAALAGVGSTTISASLGTVSLAATGYAPWSQFGTIWLTWWLGDAAGAAVVAPLIVLWFKRGMIVWPRKQWLEGAALAATAVVVPWFVFVVNRLPLAYVCLPALAWAAFRFGQREVIAGIAILAIVATAGTEAGSGPFTLATRNQSLLALQAFLFSVSLMMLSLATVVWERRRADADREGLRLSAERERARLVAVLDQLQAAVVIADAPLGRLVYANKQMATLYGQSFMPSGSPAGFDLEGAYHRDGQPYTIDEWPLVRSVRRGEVVLDEDIEVARPDGTRLTVRIRSAPLREEGRIVGAVAVYQDVTDQFASNARERAAREAAEAASRAKDEFLAMLSHELRNPLAAITSAVGILQLSASGASEVAERAIDVVNRQTKHLASLVDDLLDVSRITSGKIALQRRAVNMNTLLTRALEASRPQIDARGHTLSMSAPTEELWVDGDLTRLIQVVCNLLNNAAKYTPYGGAIWLSLQREDHDAVVRVRDNGDGIAPALLPRVFDLFTQGDRTLDRTEGGLGLGLALARRLVEMHKGRIEATSDGPGKGSEFVVRLPLLAEHAHPHPRVTPPAERPAQPRRVLVVDDNVDSAASMATLLRLKGNDTRVAHNGPAALRAAAEYHPDLVLLDIGLPGMDGYEVAERLRAAENGHEVMLVAMTGYGQDEDRRRTRSAGFDDHLVKPVPITAVEKILNDMRT
jgi:signal transduction histidine kinase